MTEVERATRCIVSGAVVWERTWEALQETIERAAPARQYYSDAFPTYETLVYYPGHHAVIQGITPSRRARARPTASRPPMRSCAIT